MGASSGIGRELAILYASQGHVVGIAGRRKKLLEKTRKLFPRQIKIKQINVVYHQKALARTHELIQSIGGMDMYIHSAGIGKQNPSLHFQTDKDIIHTNVEGFSRLLAKMYLYFQQQGHGHLVGITSIAGIRGIRFAPSYSASKSFQHTYIEALQAKAAKEKNKLIITEIIPGFVDTPMCKDKRAFWIADSQKTARQIAEALRKKKQKAYITHRWKYIAYLLKMAPTKILNRI